MINVICKVLINSFLKGSDSEIRTFNRRIIYNFAVKYLIMKTAIYETYGGPEVIELIELKKPIPKPDEILVRIKASAVTQADTLMRKGEPKFGRLFLGLFKPKNKGLGTGFSGVVEVTGKDVAQFKIDDEVFGEVLFKNGANTEYVCIKQDAVILNKPVSTSHKEAAPICDGFLTSYSFLKDIGKLKKGQHILINGASGSLGTAAVQLAKIMGARVTGVCSGTNIDLVKSLGADKVIDYKTSNFINSGDYYDVIYDVVGKASYRECKKVLTFNGVFISPVLSGPLLWYSIFLFKKVKFSATGMRKHEDLKKLLYELILFFKQGKIKTIVDKEYKLEQIVDAHKYVESGFKTGNVIVVN